MKRGDRLRSQHERAQDGAFEALVTDYLRRHPGTELRFAEVVCRAKLQTARARAQEQSQKRAVSLDQAEEVTDDAGVEA